MNQDYTELMRTSAKTYRYVGIIVMAALIGILLIYSCIKYILYRKRNPSINFIHGRRLDKSFKHRDQTYRQNHHLWTIQWWVCMKDSIRLRNTMEKIWPKTNNANMEYATISKMILILMFRDLSSEIHFFIDIYLVYL